MNCCFFQQTIRHKNLKGKTSERIQYKICKNEILAAPNWSFWYVYASN